MSSRYTSRQTTVRFEDSASTGLTVGPGKGTLTVGEQRQGNAAVQKTRNRGAHDGFVVTEDLVQECSIEIELVNQAMTSAVAARIFDFIRKTNFYSALVSLDPTIWAWRTVVTMNDGTTTSTMTLPLCEGAFTVAEDPAGHTVGITFNNHGTITYT